MPRSAQGVVLANLFATSTVFSLQLFCPNRLYDGHISSWFSDNLGLRRAPLTPATEPAHGVVLCLNFAILVHIFSASMSSRPHAHAGLALMEFSYSLAALGICYFYPKFGSGILFFGALPNLAFATAICIVGRHGPRDMVNLVMGDAAVLRVDQGMRKKDKE
ncbi:hypothetical protein FRB95_012157 [Tulasnella sp. JGI-2019a]|nr:hypothetical protein FRB95_012157 [Tulasnella sp. JGI-2019a]